MMVGCCEAPSPAVNMRRTTSGLFRDFWRQHLHFGAFSFQNNEHHSTERCRETLYKQGLFWSEREDLNLRPLVSQTSALTGLRHAPMPFP
jgi:hypothetical protein